MTNSFRWRAAKGLGGFIAASCVAAFTGCHSAPKYRMARDDAPPAQLFNVSFPAAPLQASLTALVVNGGPGSWKREALWDEYVLTVRNESGQQITVVAAELTDHLGGTHVAGDDPWKLEQASKVLCKEYDRIGVQFVASAMQAVSVVGGVAVGAAALAAVSSTSAITVTALQGPIALVTVPSYVLGRTVANHEDRLAIESTFRMRRLPLPLTVAVGQTRVGAFFFPMVTNPRALTVHWQQAERLETSTLPLEFLQGLHVAIVPPRADH